MASAHAAAQPRGMPPSPSNTKSMKNLLLRSLSGIVYVGVIVAGLMLGHTVFKCFVELLTFLALQELLGLCNRHNTPTAALLLDLAGGAVLVLAVYGLAAADPHAALIYAALFTAYLVLRLVVQLFIHPAAPLECLAYSLMGQLYVALPLALMAAVYCRMPQGPMWLLAMFVMIWLNDTGAYCTGSLLGRHKMSPRISPKKSWEGFAGGVAFSIAGAMVMRGCWPGAWGALSFVAMGGMAVTVSLFATWGDLAESLIKRTLGVKDSGRLIPGHGGILDRIDSLLLVSPALCLYLLLVML